MCVHVRGMCELMGGQHAYTGGAGGLELKHTIQDP